MFLIRMMEKIFVTGYWIYNCQRWALFKKEVLAVDKLGAFSFLDACY